MVAAMKMRIFNDYSNFIFRDTIFDLTICFIFKNDSLEQINSLYTCTVHFTSTVIG